MTGEKRAFILGMIVDFSECVAGGCKRLALSPPLYGDDYAEVSGEACEIIEKHGLIHYHERNEDAPEAGRWVQDIRFGRAEQVDCEDCQRPY